MQLSFRVVPLRATDTKQELVAAAANAFGLGSRAGNYTLALWNDHKKNTEARCPLRPRPLARSLAHLLRLGAREGALRALAQRGVAQ